MYDASRTPCNVIKGTYNTNKKKADEWLAKAKTAEKEIDRLDYRARGLGVLEANLVLLEMIGAFGFKNDTELFEAPKEDSI